MARDFTDSLSWSPLRLKVLIYKGKWDWDFNGTLSWPPLRLKGLIWQEKVGRDFTDSLSWPPLLFAIAEQPAGNILYTWINFIYHSIRFFTVSISLFSDKQTVYFSLGETIYLQATQLGSLDPWTFQPWVFIPTLFDPSILFVSPNINIQKNSLGTKCCRDQM
jgi:hypothetical protein